MAVDPADIITRFTEGRVDPRHLRGRSSYPAAVQVAQHHARAAFGDERIDALAPLDVTDVDDGGHVVITLQGPRGPIGVRLRETFSEPIFTMCQARSAGPVKQWELVSISALE